LDTTTTYPAKYKIKMARFGYAQQVLEPAFAPNNNYLGYKNFPSMRIAYDLAEFSEYDLLSCQDFMRNFIQVIIDTLSLDEKVVLYGIGTFKPETIVMQTADPVAVRMALSSIAVDDTNYIWCAVGLSGAANQVNRSVDNLHFEAVSTTNEIGNSAISFSPYLGLFCSVGTRFNIDANYFATMTSATGESWTETQTPEYFAPTCVIWSLPALQFICAGYDLGLGNLALSADGISWTMSDIPDLGVVTGLAYSESLEIYVAVGWTTGAADKAYSYDLVTWHASPDHFGRTYANVAYCKKRGLFCAVSINSGTIRASYSADGENWTETVVGSATTVSGIVAGEGKAAFIITAYQSGSPKLFKTYNGINWIQIAETLTIIPAGACYSELTNIFAVVSLSASVPAIAISQGGGNWYESRTTADSPPPVKFRNILTYRPSHKLEELIN